MSVLTVSLFLALLTAAAQAAIGAGLALGLAALGSARAARAAARLAEVLGASALPLGALVAVVATAGSLYFSEVAGFPPCKLCWYQRIAMYPLVPILALAAWRRDLAVRPYAATLCVAGFVGAGYHYALQRFPALEGAACDPATPCTAVWVWRLHYVSIPLMAATAFLATGLLLLLARPSGAWSADP